eukprot:CCRYP_015028-RD/>CCRYP_015028-RD protein AED:0.45 eAED:0.45 QI:0/-1/0/1/-1/0/1/0/153
MQTTRRSRAGGTIFSPKTNSFPRTTAPYTQWRKSSKRSCRPRRRPNWERYTSTHARQLKNDKFSRKWDIHNLPHQSKQTTRWQKESSTHGCNQNAQRRWTCAITGCVTALSTKTNSDFVGDQAHSTGRTTLQSITLPPTIAMSDQYLSHHILS